MKFEKPRLVIAALRGGSGKTIVSMGLAAAWRLRRGMRVVPFKKGPDYIDAGWLSVAAGGPCYNLDPFLMNPDEMLCSFVRRSSRGDLSLVEGNRGLYDGVDIQGSFATSEVAKLLRAPVVLVLDATKMTRTAAALVLGCRHLDPEVNIAGVILNQVAGKRHEQVLRGAIEQYCGVPVVGVVPKQKGNLFPERHLGLVPPQESKNIAEAIEVIGNTMAECIDMDAIERIAAAAPALGWPTSLIDQKRRSSSSDDHVVIGIIRDSAFQFYYPENIEALEDKGAVIREISSLDDTCVPAVDALYIGGGFPETHLELLAKNRSFRDSLKREIDAGLPVYAECGGLMYLCSGINHGRGRYPMTGIFPFEVFLETKPQGHGYTIVECVEETPFFPRGASFRGHEFHYSKLVGEFSNVDFAFKLSKGHGIVAGWDGMCYKNVLASYSHVHAEGNDQWAEAMVCAARAYRRERSAGNINARAGQEKTRLIVNEYSTAL
jgi:cobyrinic acid a,c-diamide synthase